MLTQNQYKYKFAVVYKNKITAVSEKLHNCIDHADKYSKPGYLLDCLLGVIPQPTDSRLSETSEGYVK